MNRLQFNKLVTKIGGREQAARIMGVTKETVSQAMVYGPRGTEGSGACHGPVLGAATLLELQRAAGALRAAPQPAPGNGAGEIVFFDHTALRDRIERFVIGEHPDGFQRPWTEARVAEIELEARSGYPQFGPIIVGRLPDGHLAEIEGGHRREGAVRAGIGWWVQILTVKSLDEARLIYLRTNTKQKPPRAMERYAATRNPLSVAMRELQQAYGLSFKQLHALLLGLLGRSVDFVDPSRALDPAMRARAEVILAAWSRDPRWGKKTATIFNSPQCLRALGQLARDYDTRNLERALEILLGEECARRFHGGGPWAGQRSARALSRMIKDFLAPRLLGGVTARRGTRGRAR